MPDILDEAMAGVADARSRLINARRELHTAIRYADEVLAVSEAGAAIVRLDAEVAATVTRVTEAA